MRKARPSRQKPWAHGAIVAVALACTAWSSPTCRAQRSPGPGSPAAIAGPADSVRVVVRGGYPELHVDGEPFFVHAAPFDYYRLPRDLWETSLESYRRLGINTIDLAIPWNWHEPREGVFDFDGRTNPRRDLRGLLRRITVLGFKLVVRVGPMIGNQWRHGGYPDWLLDRPEYGMDPVSRITGAYLPPAGENRAGLRGSRAWWDTATHRAYVRGWLAALAQELAPYASDQTLKVSAAQEDAEKLQGKEVSGPLLFVEVGDSPGGDGSGMAASLRYWEALREMLESAGLHAPVTVGSSSLAADGLPEDSTSRPFGVTGRWNLTERGAPEEVDESPLGHVELTAKDVSRLGLLAGSLKTQTTFPPLLMRFESSRYAAADEDAPPFSPAENTLLGSRLAIAQGILGLEYSPLQDTLTPAGFGTPGANRYFHWDAALDLRLERQPRGRAVVRNANLLAFWGDFLASAHKRADFGLVDLRAAGRGNSAKSERISRSLMQIERITEMAGLTDELVDPENLPVELLLRNAILLMPVTGTGEKPQRFSDAAQQRLVEYVRRGGTLVAFPSAPAGAGFSQLRKSSPGSFSSPQTGTLTSWQFGEGHYIEWTDDFYSWVPLERSLAETRTQFEADWALASLHAVLQLGGIRPAVIRTVIPGSPSELIVSQLVSNPATGLLGARTKDCAAAQVCREGLLSVTNPGESGVATETVRVLPPDASARAGSTGDYIELPVSVAPRESLLLPLHYSLCSAAERKERCADEVVAAGAELLGVAREGKALLLAFYAPSQATVLLQLEREPHKLSLVERNLRGAWYPAKHLLEVTMPRGASPDFIRVLRVDLRYNPRVPKEETLNPERRGLEYTVADAVRLPLGWDASLPSDPPLVLLDAERKGRMLVEVSSTSEYRYQYVTAEVTGAAHGSDSVPLNTGDTRFATIRLRGDDDSSVRDRKDAAASALLSGNLELHAGAFRVRTPVKFLVVAEGAPVHYRYDFDRDGADEWVLENKGLRLILSPEDGGRAWALVDSALEEDLTTSVGAMRDVLTWPAPDGSPREFALTAPYAAEWLTEADSPAVRLAYPAAGAGANASLLDGFHVEKTARLVDPRTVEVNYDVSLPAAPPFTNSDGSSPGPAAAAAFATTLSVPARTGRNRTTRFCWQPPSSATVDGELPDSGEAPGQHCENFAPGGVIAVPAGIKRLAVRTPGHPGLEIEWTTGRLTLETKQRSALLRLDFPSPESGGGAVECRMRYTRLPVQ